MKENKLKTNLDTNFLKLIAILCMLVDHAGDVFFPEYPVFRWVGRLAFPIFCYCMTVGLLYTHDIRRYLLRLGLFAIISQPFYVLAFHPGHFTENFTQWNIFFTLFLSLLAMWGFQQKKWWLFALAAFVVCWWNFDYSGNGILLMLIFYLCRNKPALGAFLFVLNYVPAFFHGDPNDPLSWMVAGHAIDWTAFAILAAPFIFLRTDFYPRIPKGFFYVFYPAHLAVIAGVRLIFQV